MTRWSETRIAATHHVTQSTISYRLKRCRRQIEEGTRRALRERLPLSEPELDSLMRLWPSEISLSL